MTGGNWLPSPSTCTTPNEPGAARAVGAWQPLPFSGTHPLPMNSSPYGGSVTMASIDSGSMPAITSRQSPW